MFLFDKRSNEYNIMNGSPKFSLSLFDWKKIGTGAMVGVGGLFLTYIAPVALSTSYVFTIKGQQYDATPVVWIVMTTVVNVVRKFLSDTVEYNDKPLA